MIGTLATSCTMWGPICSVITNKNPNVAVTIVDLSLRFVEAWQSNEHPIHEPNLLEVVQSARDERGVPANLFFSTDIDTVIRETDWIVVSVNTPTKFLGRGKGRASELSYFELAISRIASVATSDRIIVEKSTVPVRTAENMRGILMGNYKPGVKFEILSNPEFLAEGTPSRISYSKIVSSWVPRCCLLPLLPIGGRSMRSKSNRKINLLVGSWPVFKTPLRERRLPFSDLHSRTPGMLESAAISIVHVLITEGDEIGIYDPQAPEESIWFEIKAACNNPELVGNRVKIHHTPYEACDGAHAVVIFTEWDEFGNKTPVALKKAALHQQLHGTSWPYHYRASFSKPRSRLQG
ncbi:UDP-glucose/GDP-mannose dehydrogenase family, NAD binding domain-containing protein [Rhexocercosporidium sp. MPI-PUGE-AT-0058]|nr:UDP-glucose/GDP-mannose dehydrogenase family, NAD binding domain-containing protein [Rhexocercosporidium sp. MPI-PUGE-AT-0058]